MVQRILKTEGLLLLITLTEANADIQKIVAFENAFERLFSIIIAEGSTDGEIIVQDCIHLMQNLLRYNISNQNLFRETNCIKQIPLLFNSNRENVQIPICDPSVNWTVQKSNNTSQLMILIRTLVGPNTPNTSQNQSGLGSSNLIHELFQLAMLPTSPEDIKSLAIFTVADLIRNHLPNQETFARGMVPLAATPAMSGLPNQKSPPGIPTSSIIAVINSSLSKGPFLVRMAAGCVFQAYLSNNPDIQLAMVSTILPSPVDNPNSALESPPTSPGFKLVSAMLDIDAAYTDPYRSWFASGMLAAMIHENQEAKCQIIAKEMDADQGNVSIVHKAMFALVCASRDSMDVRIQVGILTFLSICLFDCIPATTEFLSDNSNVQFVIFANSACRTNQSINRN